MPYKMGVKPTTVCWNYWCKSTTNQLYLKHAVSSPTKKALIY